jgi:hypothetical protein
MKAANFKDWALTKLDKTFGLAQIWESTGLDDWRGIQWPIDELETKTMTTSQMMKEFLRFFKCQTHLKC